MKYSPLSPALEPLFEEGAHVYRYKGWKPPSVSRILEATGVKAPFDRTFWRLALLRKGMTEEEAEAEMDLKAERGIERGKSVHSLIEATCKAEPVAIEDFCPGWLELGQFQGYQEGFLQFISDYGVSEVLLIERPLVNTVALYCGTVDCLAVTKYGPAVIDWKTTEAIKKSKRKDWMKHQLAAYAGCINRLFDIEPVKQGINVALAPDGFKTYHYQEDEFLETWTNLKGLLRDYWGDRLYGALGPEGDEEEASMALKALEGIEQAWGPFEEVTTG